MNEIPKIIHFCWFGGSPLPKSAKKFIKSWKKHFSDYEIKRWDESNFDINMMPYTKEAYERKKYAFLSDVARFWILYNYGGIYFDTDVKVICSFNDILEKGPFMGRELNFEESEKIGTLGVAPGLGIASYAFHPLFKEILDHYSNLHFIDENGDNNLTTVVEYVSDIFHQKGLRNEKFPKCIENIMIYPSEFFCPISPVTFQKKITPNTHSIHYFAASWIPKKKRMISHFGKKYPYIMKPLLVIKHLLDGTRPLLEKK